MIASNALDKVGEILIGRKLLASKVVDFLWKGITFAFFQALRYLIDVKISLKINVINGKSCGKIKLINLREIVSRPALQKI